MSRRGESTSFTVARNKTQKIILIVRLLIAQRRRFKMIEPSDADLNSCPEVVQQYVKQLEAEASEKYYICPIMSRVVIGSNHGESMPDSSDLIEIKCLGKDTALS